MSLVFSTKAGTLAQLQGLIATARVAPLYYFSVADWLNSSSACLAQVELVLGAGPWIVRSSCLCEDGVKGSNAGKFLSLPDVTLENLESAINQVIASYHKIDNADEILIQPMLKNILRSGVAFSHDPNTCSPYRVISWVEGNDASVVTGGLGGRTWQQAARAPIDVPEYLRDVMMLLDELVEKFNGVPIDIEFAVTSNVDYGSDNDGDILWLLQVRRLILSSVPIAEETQAEYLDSIQASVAKGLCEHPFLKGRRTAYGVMPDWNPAEIIGVRPRPLALSLYRELITDSIWAYQRNNYGYCNLRGFPLMLHFFGLPYIDVRVSFNSFIPSDLDENLAERLVDYYIDRLLVEPSLHDKVEFEIVFSCYSLDLPERLASLEEAGFSKAEREKLESSLRRLTNRIVHPKTGLWKADVNKLKILNNRRKLLQDSNVHNIERIYWLLEDAKRYGTLPFAGLARAGFVAMQILKSLVSTTVLTTSDYDRFMAGLSTVSGELARDKTKLSRSDFLARYGHLRPGTYDILSPRYDKDPALYFDWSKNLAVTEPSPPFVLTSSQRLEVLALLKTHGLQFDPEGLFDFLQRAIESRELAKFNFTRNLSDALELIVDFGSQWGFSRDDLSYSDIVDFKELFVGSVDPEKLLSQSIELGRKRYQKTLSLSLPPVITEPNDVWGFEWPDTSPNFITLSQVTASVVNCSDKDKLEGAVVCIPNADPGFDWLFAYPIAGLITAWGGVNSHMAIRAGEQSLPAVIGAGEKHYLRWSAAHRLHIDCAGQRVEILE